MSQYTLDFRHFDQEAEFVARLRQHGRGVYLGDTEPHQRRERIRVAVLSGRLEAAIFGRDTEGKPQTYREKFEEVFGEPLEKSERRRMKA